MKVTYSIIYTILYFSIISCASDDSQRKFEQEAYAKAENYTETTLNGNILKVDSDDWRISPFYSGLVNVEPISPNPVQYSNTTYLNVEIKGTPVSTSIELGYLDNTNSWFPLETQIIEIEFYTITFNVNTRQLGSTAEQARGLHRLLLFDGNQRLISYGDLLIQ